MTTARVTTTVEVEPLRAISLRASELAFDYDKCPRCFYLKAVEGVDTPQGIFSGLNSKLDSLTREYFKNKGSFCSDAPKGEIVKSNYKVIAEPMIFADYNLEITLSGMIDNLVRLEGDEESWAIIATKNSDPAKHLSQYTRQANAYKYMLEHAIKPELRRTPVTRLGIVVFDAIEFIQGKINSDNFFKWVELDCDADDFQAYMEVVAESLASEKVPAFSEDKDCSYCKRDRALLARYEIQID
jgi:hypothetical protein